MAGKDESIEAHPAGDWDTPFRNTPDCPVGEFARVGANPVVADLNAPSFTETSRSTYGGDTSRSQAKFRTTDSTKRS